MFSFDEFCLVPAFHSLQILEQGICRTVQVTGIHRRNAEQSFAIRALMDDQLKLVTLTGKAGSGKTLLALAAAIESRSRYSQTLLARPAYPMD